VTLVGILAADMSLHVSDYHAAERTFQLLTQAAGRAGRGSRPGQVIIQSYDPDHYAVQTAARQDYEAFYEQETAYRSLLHYPPVWNLLVILCTSPEEQGLAEAVEFLYRRIEGMTGGSGVQLIGPADASVSKINDIYRKVIYLKTDNYDKLVAVKDAVERLAAAEAVCKGIGIQFDFNPMSGF
jgi:primosomal protein N' (replication factor Y)